MKVKHKMTVFKQQQGFVTLIISLSFLVLLTIIVFYGVGTGIQKQRISANEVRAREAQVAADAGQTATIDMLTNRLNELDDSWVGTKWVDCTTQAADVRPCDWGNLDFRSVVSGTGGGEDFTFVGYRTGAGNANVVTAEAAFFDTPPNLSAAYVLAKSYDGESPVVGFDSLFHVISVGTSGDNTARTDVQQAYQIRSSLGIDAAAPLIAASTADITGSFEILGNPDGGGDNSNLSAWTDQPVNPSGNFYTCEIGAYLNDSGGSPVGVNTTNGTVLRCDKTSPGAGSVCDCSKVDATAGKLSYRDAPAGFVEEYDIFEDVGNTVFDNLFGNFFGYTDTDTNDPNGTWTTDMRDPALERMAAEGVNDCGDLDNTSSGTYWFTSNCQFGNVDIGSPEDPVLVVVQDADFNAQGGSVVFGMVFIFDQNNDGLEDIQLVGGPYIYGAIISEVLIKSSGGNATLRYDKVVLQNLIDDDASGLAGRILGTYTTYAH